jgi:WD40 repeat protein
MCSPETISMIQSYWSLRNYQRVLVTRVGSILVALMVTLLGNWSTAMAQQARTLAFHDYRADQVAFSPDGKTLASANTVDDTVVLWDVATLEKRAVLRGRSAQSVAFSPDGRVLAAGITEMPKINKPIGVVKLWDLAKSEEIGTLKGELLTNPVWSVAFSPDSSLVAAGSSSPARQRLGPNMENADKGEVKLWEVATRRLRAVLAMRAGPAYGVAFSPDGRILASGGGTLEVQGMGELRLWEVTTGKLKVKVKSLAAPVFAVAFSPDGKTIATAGGIPFDIIKMRQAIAELKLWDVETGNEIAALNGHSGLVHGVAFSPDGKVLASGGGEQSQQQGEIILWDVAHRRMLMSLEGHKDLVTSAAFSPDGSTLASGSFDKTVKLWSVREILRQKANK